MFFDNGDEITSPMGASEEWPVRVECLECGKKATVRSTDPECPRCGSVDLEVL
jgi:Zn finger protein HypA/HybF involved in hydrogenase expression